MNGIISRSRLAIVLGVSMIAIAAAGCDTGAAYISEGRVQQEPAESVPPAWYRGERPVLRVRVDLARNRLWALTWDGVEIYDVKTREKLAQVALPDWIWLRQPYSCAPALAVGPKGEAVVSSNVVPTLWRIDPVSFAVSKHELVLDDAGKDIGYSGLAYSAEQGAYFAVSALQGSLWRIDPLMRRAENITLSAPIRKACALAVQPRVPDRRAGRFVDLCIRGDQGDSIVSLAPHQRSGYVSSRACTVEAALLMS